MDEAFYKTRHIRYRRVYMDLVQHLHTDKELTSQQVADRTGLTLEPMLLMTKSVFVPEAFTSFVRLTCSDASHVGEPSQLDRSDFVSAQTLASRRIIVVGDLHGDFENTCNVFRMAGLIDTNQNWAAGNATIFVQTGDVVDRGDDTILLYNLLHKLKLQAFSAGSDVIQVLGNHETLNMAQDLRFVTPGDTYSFGGAAQRKRAWQASGFIGRHLYNLNLVQRVGNTVFCHGGVSFLWSAFPIQLINDATHRLLPKMSHETDLYTKMVKYPLFFGDDSPSWYRGFAMDPEGTACPLLKKALMNLGVERMVVGHTPQMNGKILKRCGGRFMVVDVGISHAYGRNAAALELAGDEAFALYPQGKEMIAKGFLD
jgi:hypothetical protein